MRVGLAVLLMVVGVPAAGFAQAPAPVEQRAPPADADKDKATSTSWGDSAKHGKDADTVKGDSGSKASKSPGKKKPTTPAGAGATSAK